MADDLLYISRSDSYVQGHMIKQGEIVNVQTFMLNVKTPSLVIFTTRRGYRLQMKDTDFNNKFKLERGM